MSVKVNTIDLDYCSKEKLYHVIDLILNKQAKSKRMRTQFNLHSCSGSTCCDGIIVKDSMFKGYHLLLFCKKHCDLCRFVFDDSKRFSMDFRKGQAEQNVLFDSVRSLRSRLVKPSRPPTEYALRTSKPFKAKHREDPGEF